MLPRSPLVRRAVVAGAAAVCCGVPLGGCGDEPAALREGLSARQVRELDRVWSQRIQALAAAPPQAAAAATALNRRCAAMAVDSTFLQAVRATCAPTALSVKLAAIIPRRCEQATRRCARALDRAAAANDTQLVTLVHLSDAVKIITDDPACRAVFTTQGATAQAYRERSAAFSALRRAAKTHDDAAMPRARARVVAAEQALHADLSVAAQLRRYRDACDITA